MADNKSRAKPIPFEEVFERLQRYVEKNGHCNVPQGYKDEDDVALGIIVAGIRSGNRTVSEEEREMLDSIGFCWKVRKK